jgi:hypothetical protein
MPKKLKITKKISTSSVLWLLDLKYEIRDLAWKKIRILDKHPGSATLVFGSLSIPDSGFLEL